MDESPLRGSGETDENDTFLGLAPQAMKVTPRLRRAPWCHDRPDDAFLLDRLSMFQTCEATDCT